MSTNKSSEKEEIVTFGMEIRLTGTRDEVDMAIGDLTEDATEQAKWRNVEVSVEEPVEIETVARKRVGVEMMDEGEICDGWSNRETRTAYIWLSNNMWMQNERRRRMMLLVKTGIGTDKILQHFVEGMIGAVGFGNMFDEIGDIKQVNWKELADTCEERDNFDFDRVKRF